MKKPNLSLFDERLLEKYISMNLTSKKEYEDYLKTLPDDKDNVAYTVIKDDHEQDND